MLCNSNDYIYEAMSPCMFCSLEFPIQYLAWILIAVIIKILIESNIKSINDTIEKYINRYMLFVYKQHKAY